MAQLNALSEMNENEFESFKLAEMYRLWYLSGPFDIGHTTRLGLKTLARKDIPNDQLVEATYANVNIENAKSESNGSLMRCTPIAAFSHLLSTDDLHKVVIADGNFTHCHPNVMTSVFLYCHTIGQLIKYAENPDRATLAYNSTYSLCKDRGTEEVK